ncbi:Outer membrane efflux protein [Planctomycetes bacterium Poly30]|uniref:Outer membrane efflux protein n=1 Tax=Saltatorellus ferox TaxID=2528018 RepID=A0A518EW79_9BACT|nr:Outer membrane efflux protein [Planctomycetes bacterium Poly30]
MASGDLLTGCYSPPELRDRADRDALALVDQRRAQLFGENSPFALPAVTASFGREDRPQEEWTIREQILSGVIDEVGPLNVVTSLEIAAENSQEVQEQREQLYLSALTLTQDRWNFGYRYNADGTGDVGGQLDGDGSSASTGFGASVTRVLGSGATILASVGSNLFRFISTGDGWDALSNVGVSVTQPLLRGSGRLITLEPLRQSERNLIYGVRSYERFRRTYAVDVASRVYRVLQARNQLYNERLNFDNLLLLSRRNDALAEAGQLSEIQADQARQDQLRSKNRLVTLQGNVDRQLDAFKVFLGLPLSVELDFEDGILESLGADSSFIDGLDQDVAVEFAIDHRLDVMTSFDRVQDATRREAITRDALRVGLTVSGAVNSTSPDGRPLSFQGGDANWSAAVDLDLPVDLLPARNAWRRAEINLVDTKRTYDRFLDNVSVTVRDALRRAKNSYQSFEIQRNAVYVANRRVEGTLLSQKAGLATTRDILESQEAQRQARDAETSARIDYTLALLDLWLELEILRVDENGVRVEAELAIELRERLAAAAFPNQAPTDAPTDAPTEAPAEVSND